MLYRVYQLVSKERVNFDSDINVSVFETNIRIVGGLLGAHLMAKRYNLDPLNKLILKKVFTVPNTSFQRSWIWSFDLIGSAQPSRSYLLEA